MSTSIEESAVFCLLMKVKLWLSSVHKCSGIKDQTCTIDLTFSTFPYEYIVDSETKVLSHNFLQLLQDHNGPVTAARVQVSLSFPLMNIIDI